MLEGKALKNKLKLKNKYTFCREKIFLLKLLNLAE